MTTENRPSAEKWLSDEDSKCYDDRLSRLQFLAGRVSAAEYWTFPGGLLAKSLFEEARYCFVYGQFLATALLGLAYQEITLAALFYGEGRDDLQSASLHRLLSEALATGLIDESEYQELERVRKKRNAYAHFRRPGHKDSIEFRAILGDELPYSIVEQDAVTVITVTLRMVAKNAF